MSKYSRYLIKISSILDENWGRINLFPLFCSFFGCCSSYVGTKLRWMTQRSTRTPVSHDITLQLCPIHLHGREHCFPVSNLSLFWIELITIGEYCRKVTKTRDSLRQIGIWYQQSNWSNILWSQTTTVCWSGLVSVLLYQILKVLSSIKLKFNNIKWNNLWLDAEILNQ